MAIRETGKGAPAARELYALRRAIQNERPAKHDYEDAGHCRLCALLDVDSTDVAAMRALLPAEVLARVDAELAGEGGA